MASASIHRRADLAEINVQQDAMCDSLSRLALLTGAVNAWKLASVHDAYLVLLSNFLHSLFKTFSKTRRKRKHEGFWVCTDNDNRVTSYLKRTVSGWWHVSKKRRTTNKPIKRCGCLAVSAHRMLHLALLGKTTLMFCRQQELHWILISCTSNSRYVSYLKLQLLTNWTQGKYQVNPCLFFTSYSFVCFLNEWNIRQLLKSSEAKTTSDSRHRF